MKLMKKQFIELLNIHATSGNETPVRDYLKPILKDLTDEVITDNYGNLLAEKKVGTGKGATIMLSAHMDTVKGVKKERKLVENRGIISSDVGALGADDRAGIAIILTVLRNIDKLSFNGTIKIAFSREEEIGCIGSDKINKEWYKDVDLAIVVDRQGNRDIVVGCGMAFCSNSVGFFMEDVGKLVEQDWKCVEGGISDAMTFAQNGINSVNLSAGYMNEHTDREYASLADMKDTIRYIMQVFGVINEFYETFEELPIENRWVKAWYYEKSGKYGNMYSNEYSDDVWAEEYDQNGDIFVYEIGKDLVIQQGDNEILLSRASLRGLIEQLKNI